MLLEGVPAPTIEQASSQAGYPAPVLQLMDELNMELAAKIRKASRRRPSRPRAESSRSARRSPVVDKMLEAGSPGPAAWRRASTSTTRRASVPVCGRG